MPDRNHDFDPAGTRLPIKIDTSTNGEFAPRPLTENQLRARAWAESAAGEHARRTGLERRTFLVSSMGAAATLLACNRANQSAGDNGGSFDIPDGAAEDPELAAASVEGDEFIFDVQTHCVDPAGSWAEGKDGELWRKNLTEVFGQASKCDEGAFDCFSAQVLAKEVYLDSDTDVAVVSALWGATGQNPTPIEYAAEAREIVAAIGGEGARALIHGGVLPNEPGELDAMDEKVEVYGVEAWKMYPQWGPKGVGFFLDESDAAAKMFEKARALGVTTIAIHKGVPLPGLEYEYSSPQEMGRVAKANPDLTFLIYHAAFEPGVNEGPFDEKDPKGVDRLIAAHREAGFAPNEGNLYAEMGSLWRTYMTQPTQAAHIMGKLLKHFGAERILWGTDSIWAGSPQDQIQSFRTFKISDELREAHDYPALDKAAKAKIFGLNGARVYGIEPIKLASTPFNQTRARYRAQANPSFLTYGPKNRRDFLQLWQQRGGRPGG